MAPVLPVLRPAVLFLPGLTVLFLPRRVPLAGGVRLGRVPLLRIRLRRVRLLLPVRGLRVLQVLLLQMLLLRVLLPLRVRLLLCLRVLLLCLPVRLLLPAVRAAVQVRIRHAAHPPANGGSTSTVPPSVRATVAWSRPPTGEPSTR